MGTLELRDISAKLKKNFKVYSHNVRGLRNGEKLEVLLRLMDKPYLEGDFQKILPIGLLFIHHGPKEQPSHGAKGGVAVILSEGLAREFNNGK